MKTTRHLFSLLVILSMLTGCATPIMAVSAPQPYVTPTRSSLFDPVDPNRRVPFVVTPLPARPTAEARPTLDAESIAANSDSIDNPNEDPMDPFKSYFEMPASDAMYSEVVYRDELHPDWQVTTPGGMIFRTGALDQRHKGKTSIQVLPVGPESKLYITLKKDAKSVYPRNEVLAVDFWLYSGDKGMSLFDLAVSAIGSNDYTYYLPADRTGEIEKPYENTFLYYLGFNSDIPPNTWFNVTIWLDQMLYDPKYQFVTGFYIMNRFNYKRMFYIADVELIVKKHPRTQVDRLYEDYQSLSGFGPSPTPTLMPTSVSTGFVTETPSLPTPEGTQAPTGEPALTPTPTLTPTP